MSVYEVGSHVCMYRCVCVGEFVYVPIGNTSSALLLVGSAYRELLQPHLEWVTGFGSP